MCTYVDLHTMLLYSLVPRLKEKRPGNLTRVQTVYGCNVTANAILVQTVNIGLVHTECYGLLVHVILDRVDSPDVEFWSDTSGSGGCGRLVVAASVGARKQVGSGFNSSKGSSPYSTC